MESRERGAGTLGCVLWVVVIIVLVMVGAKAIPVKMRSSQLYDHMEEIAKFASRSPADALEKQILAKAAELELPITKDNIKVERVGDTIRMSADYVVPLEFPGYTYLWHFTPHVERSLFIF
jgi:hypothetical protein